MNERMKEVKERMKRKEELLKVKEYFGVVIEIKSENNARLQQEIIKTLFAIDGVTDIKYQRRTADKIIVIPEKELAKHGLKVI